MRMTLESYPNDIQLDYILELYVESAHLTELDGHIDRYLISWKRESPVLPFRFYGYVF